MTRHFEVVSLAVFSILFCLLDRSLYNVFKDCSRFYIIHIILVFGGFALAFRSSYYSYDCSIVRYHCRYDFYIMNFFYAKHKLLLFVYLL